MREVPRAAQALECMRAEYSQSFVEAAIAMFNRVCSGWEPARGRGPGSARKGP